MTELQRCFVFLLMPEHRLWKPSGSRGSTGDGMPTLTGEGVTAINSGEELRSVLMKSKAIISDRSGFSKAGLIDVVVWPGYGRAKPCVQ
jgi:hypothetical protein